MAKTSIYLDIRSAKEGRPAPLKISVSAGGSTCYISLGVSVLPSQWDSSRLTIVKHPRKDALNDFVTRKLLDCREAMLAVGRRGMSAAQLRDAILRRLEGDSPLLEERIEKYMSSCRTEGTRKTFAELLADLRKLDPGFSSLRMDDVDKAYLVKLEEKMARTKSVNSRSVRMRSLRAVFNAAIDEGVTENYPFRAFKIRSEATRKRALTASELRTLRDYPCEPYQEEYRDMFFLMLYLRGINAADLFEAPPDAIRDGRLEYVRKKTHKEYSVKVEPEAAGLLEKYKGEKHLVSPLDRYSNYKDYLHHMNDALKAIGRPLGKRGKAEGEGLFPGLSSYWARHTWATLAYEAGVPVDVIGQALGHSDKAHAVTMIYIRPDQRKADEADRKVIDYIKKK